MKNAPVIDARTEIVVNSWPPNYFAAGEPATKTLDIMSSSSGGHCATCQCANFNFWTGYSFFPKDDAEFQVISRMSQKDRREYVCARPEQIRIGHRK